MRSSEAIAQHDNLCARNLAGQPGRPATQPLGWGTEARVPHGSARPGP